MEAEEATVPADVSVATALGTSTRARASKGDIVGRYVVLREVGRGAMGAVFAAIDPKLDRRVALKLLLDDSGDGVAVARLIREAQSLALLNHPNVVAVYDVGEYQEHVFVAMEFVEGQTLRQWQREGPRPWRDVLAVYQQAAAGLAAAHEQGVVHRDFKPDNVMVGQDGRVRVMDFGLARAGLDASESSPTAGIDNSALTQTGSMMGTPAYMSPEQFAKDPVGPASDQFGFCVALYEALAGERPFRGASLAELSAAVRSGVIPPPRHPTSAPAWLLRVVRVGLAVRPEDRHPSMGALLHAIDRGIGMRRRWALAAAALGTGALATVAALQPSANETCARRQADLQAVWAPERAEALAAAFERTGHPEATESWKRVRERVDTFVADWTQEHDHVCGAWRVALAPELVAARRDCLGVQREHLDGLLAALAEPTTETIGFARAAAAGLPVPHECAEIDTLALAPAPETSQRVFQAQSALARAVAKRQTGDGNGARAGLEHALDILGEINAPRTRARILGQLSEMLYFQGALHEGEQAIRQAQLLAAESGDARLSALLWLERVIAMNMYQRGELDRQEHLLEAVDLAIAQAGSVAADVARAEVLRGMIAMDRAQYDVALVYLRRGLALASEAQVDGSTTPATLASYESLIGRVLMEQSDYPAAYEAQLRAVALVQQSYGPSHPSTLVHRGNLGSVCVHLGDLPCARAQFEAVTVALDAAKDDTSSLRADNLGNLASLEYTEGALPAAQKHATAALALLDRSGEGGQENAATLRGLTYYIALDQDRLPEALQQAQAIDRYYEEHRDPGHPESVNGLQLVAIALQSLKRYDEALEAFTRVLHVREAALGADHESVSLARMYRAGVLADQGKFASALPECERGYAALVAGRSRAELIAEASIRLARVRDATGDRTGAVAVAAEGLGRLQADEPATKELRAEIEAWLREHGANPGLAILE